MALTAYRTWVTGEVVTATNMNEQVRDNGNWLADAHLCKLTLNAAAATTSGTVHTLGGGTNALGTWDEGEDTDAFHDTVTNPSRITVPTGLAGIYDVLGQAQFDTSASQRRAILINKNGTLVGETNLSATRHHDGTGGSIWFAQCPVFVRMAATDYLEMQVFQNSGAGLNINGGVTTAFTAALVGR